MEKHGKISHVVLAGGENYGWTKVAEGFAVGFREMFCSTNKRFRFDLISNFHFSGAFDDPDVTHVEGEVNPVRDLDIISDELRFKDIDSLHKHLEKLEKLVVRGNDKKLKPEYVSFELKFEFYRHLKSADCFWLREQFSVTLVAE